MAIENIDIGGPAMIRAAAKNFKYVTVVVNPDRYDEIAVQLASAEGITEKLRMSLSKEAFGHTAEYDVCINQYLSKELGEGQFPETVHVVLEKVQDLRYGENPHQNAAFYREKFNDGIGVANAKQLHGKELSFNNIVDVEAAYAIVAEFEQPAATIIKHTNPCGTGIGSNILDVYTKAMMLTRFLLGGIVALNRAVDKATAEKIGAIFIEAVIAPSYAVEAIEILTQKKNIRLLTLDMPESGRDKCLDTKKFQVECCYKKLILKMH